MSRLLVLVCALALTATPALAGDPKPAKRADPTEALLDVLEQEFQFKDGANINEIPLFELLQDLAKRHGITFVINEESFQTHGLPDAKEMKPKVAATGLRGLKLRQFLALSLDSMGAAYLIKNSTIEIVPIAHAQKVTKSAPKLELDGNIPQMGEAPRLVEPLVSAVIKEKPLNETVAKLAEMYDLTVVVCPQSGDARTGFVSARLLNVPADKSLELLALQADLRVVRRGTAYLITSKDHANELFNEKLDKERQKVELQKLKEAPAKPPAPAPVPEK
jgi:hypothetical protein